MASTSGNDNSSVLAGDAMSEKFATLNILGMSKTASQDRESSQRASASSHAVSTGSGQFTPRPRREALPFDDGRDANVRAYPEAHRGETHNGRPFVNPLVHKSSFGHQAGIDTTPLSFASMPSPGTVPKRLQDSEVMKMDKDQGPSPSHTVGSFDAPFSPLSQVPGRELSLSSSSTFPQMPLNQASDSNGRRGSGRSGNEEEVSQSNSDLPGQEPATPQRKVPTKSAARSGSAATQIKAISSPANAKTISPSATRSAAASTAKPSRSTHHRPSPQLPCAPNVLPAPPPAMYWSKAPVHGSVPRRSFRAHTANLADEIMWLFGGCDAKGCFREVWCFDTETMCWSKPKVTGDLPPPRRAHSATMVDKCLYVFAGGDGPHYFNDLYVFDTVSLRWSKPEVYGQPPSPRRAHTSNYHNGQLIIFGGGNGVGALNDVFSLSIKDENRLEWKKVECKGKIPIGRGYHTSSLVDGKLIVIGGSDGHMSFNDIHVLRLDTKVWYQVKTDEIHNRLGHTATQVGSYLFIVGGHDSHSYTQEILTLNLVNLQWEPRKVSGQKPPGRGYHQAWSRDSRLFMHGGFDGKEIYDDLHYVDLAACAYLPQITSFSVELDDD